LKSTIVLVLALALFAGKAAQPAAPRCTSVLSTAAWDAGIVRVVCLEGALLVRAGRSAPLPGPARVADHTLIDVTGARYLVLGGRS
jgi:hypothetical protein